MQQFKECKDRTVDLCFCACLDGLSMDYFLGLDRSTNIVLAEREAHALQIKGAHLNVVGKDQAESTYREFNGRVSLVVKSLLSQKRWNERNWNPVGTSRPFAHHDGVADEPKLTARKELRGPGKRRRATAMGTSLGRRPVRPGHLNM